MELFQHIMQFMPQGELANASTVSHAFCDEAVKLLYRSVDLRSSNSGHIAAWSTHVSDHPKLAREVRALYLPHCLLIPVVEPASKSLDSLSRAMHSLTALTVLDITRIPRSHEMLSSPSMTFVYLNVRILMGCPFRLHTLRTEAMGWSPEEMTSFLLEQSHIRDWQTDSLKTTEAWRPGSQASLGLLPHLSITRAVSTFWQTFHAANNSQPEPYKAMA